MPPMGDFLHYKAFPPERQEKSGCLPYRKQPVRAMTCSFGSLNRILSAFPFFRPGAQHQTQAGQARTPEAQGEPAGISCPGAAGNDGRNGGTSLQVPLTLGGKTQQEGTEGIKAVGSLRLPHQVQPHPPLCYCLWVQMGIKIPTHFTFIQLYHSF